MSSKPDPNVVRRVYEKQISATEAEVAQARRDLTDARRALRNAQERVDAAADHYTDVRTELTLLRLDLARFDREHA